MSIRWSGLVVSAAALALAVVGCGGREASGEEKGGAAAAASDERIDMCELLPKAEIEAIVRTPVANTSGNFSEHDYSKPVSYTSSCMYMGQRTVMLGVTYPIPSARSSSQELAARVTEQLRSQVGSDTLTDEIFRTTQVRPVAGLAGPAAEYEMMGQTVLEVHADGRILKITAASLDDARAVAEKALMKLK
jgi:hypothetical protein